MLLYYQVHTLTARQPLSMPALVREPTVLPTRRLWLTCLWTRRCQLWWWTSKRQRSWHTCCGSHFNSPIQFHALCLVYIGFIFMVFALILGLVLVNQWLNIQQRKAPFNCSINFLDCYVQVHLRKQFCVEYQRIVEKTLLEMMCPFWGEASSGYFSSDLNSATKTLNKLLRRSYKILCQHVDLINCRWTIHSMHCWIEYTTSFLLLWI